MNILVSASYSPAHAVRKVQFRPFLIWMVLVCEGAAFIYVLAGGYSLGTPRKCYIIMPILIMSAAAAIWLIWGPQRTGTCWSSASSAVATINVICMFGCKMHLTEHWTLADTKGSCLPQMLRSALSGAQKSSVGIVVQFRRQLARPPESEPCGSENTAPSAVSGDDYRSSFGAAPAPLESGLSLRREISAA